ncbi:hypothetical protein [Granulicella arctica]|uniref:hypothetical protein n=1 Tax=Granulicella arctica TaxID=940613 RepID=UPI0021E0A329|nr:hypothetical protein [Granulicella arctica]
MMSPYQKHNPAAGVLSYEILENAIIIEFVDHKFRYLYNTSKPGLKHVNTMKRLALEGKGLSTYINQHVREHYAQKLPRENGPSDCREHE